MPANNPNANSTAMKVMFMADPQIREKEGRDGPLGRPRGRALPSGESIISSYPLLGMLGFLPCACAWVRPAPPMNNASATAQRPRVQRRSVVGLLIIDSSQSLLVLSALECVGWAADFTHRNRTWDMPVFQSVPPGAGSVIQAVVLRA
jgi:hypothetical protein